MPHGNGKIFIVFIVAYGVSLGVINLPLFVFGICTVKTLAYLRRVRSGTYDAVMWLLGFTIGSLMWLGGALTGAVVLYQNYEKPFVGLTGLQAAGIVSAVDVFLMLGWLGLFIASRRRAPSALQESLRRPALEP